MLLAINSMSTVTIVGVTIVIIIIAAISKSKDMARNKGVYYNVVDLDLKTGQTNDLSFVGSWP